MLDIATTPQRLFDLPTKRMWLVVIVAFWVFGAAAWLMAGRGEVRARRRWEATSACCVAPDDNPEFLLELEHRIKGWREGV